MQVAGLTIEQVDRLSDDFEALVVREMRAAARIAAQRLGSRLEAQASTATVSQGDVNIIFRLWDSSVDEALLPALEGIWLAGANHQREQVEAAIPLLAAVSMPNAEGNAGASAPPPPPSPPPIFVRGTAAAVSYLSNAKNRLRNIGNELWSAARISLTAGMSQGESIPKLSRRVTDAVGVARARATMIARTEVIGAANWGSIYAMRSTNGLVTRKSWLATNDGRTRETHVRANGQTVDLAGKFVVGNGKLDHPGDWYGPPEEIINCRCTMTYEVEMPPPDEAASFTADADPLVAVAVSETTGMIALRPASPDDFVVEGGEDADELHVTVTFLGEVSDELREAAIETAQRVAGDSDGPFTARVAGYGVLGAEDAVVLFLNGDGFSPIHAALSGADLAAPEQWAPWICHMTLGYGIDVGAAEQFIGREFEVDALSVDVGDTHERFELGKGAVTVRADASPEVFQDECPPGHHRMPDGTCMPDEEMNGSLAKWRGVIVVEDTPTGDGRQFAADSLTWPDMPLPLQWQKETTHGGMNDVVVTVGTIESIERVGNELIGEGFLDLGSEDGREAYRRVKPQSEGGLGLGGVSIVADDPEQADVEFVYPEGCADLDDLTPEEIQEQVSLEELEKCFTPILMIFHSGRVRALTIVDTPAFVEAKIEIVDEAEVTAAVGAPVELRIGENAYRLGSVDTDQKIQDEALREFLADLTEKLGGELVHFTPVRSHETGTSDDSWDGPANEGRLPSPMSVSTAENAYAWIDRDAVEDGEMPKSAGRFIHHNVSDGGTPGAANVQACRTGIGVLNGARGGTTIPSADREGVYNHLARHMRDAGEDPPELASVEEAAALAAAAFDPETLAEWEALVAAAYTVTIPDVPPAEWYMEPKELPPIGALRVTPEGRLYGLVAPKGVGHRGFSKRIEVPMRNVDYSRFMSRPTPVALADNTVEEIPAGPITMNCGHAATTGPNIDSASAKEHYDNSCSVVATVRIGENDKGVWVAGALTTGVEPKDLARLLACQLSGDWRPHPEKPGIREFVAALVVPTPGFASAGPTVRLDHGELVTASVPVRFDGDEALVAAIYANAGDVQIKTFSTTDEEGETTETTVEVTTETEVEIDLPEGAEEEIVEEFSGTVIDEEPVTAAYVDDLPDFAEVIRSLDPAYQAAQAAEAERKAQLAVLVASVKGGAE